MSRPLPLRCGLPIVGFCLLAHAVAAAAAAPAKPPPPGDEPRPPVTLRAGDPAPPLALGRWLKGEPVKAFEPGTVYVLEFWATWCPPCVAHIPDVSAAQARNKEPGVIFIGVDVGDEADPAKAAALVRGKGDAMNYRAAMEAPIDGSERGRMWRDWVVASGQGGIPCTFVVDQRGRIAWIGELGGLRPVLKQLLASTFDARRFEREDAFRARLAAVSARLSRGEIESKEALAMLDEEMRLRSPDRAGQVDCARFHALWQAEKYNEANRAAVRAADAADAHPDLLAQVAWRLAAGEPGPPNRDLELADRLAARANELSDGEDPSVLSTYARVLFDKGDRERAIATQAKAVELETFWKDAMRADLERYKAAPAVPASDRGGGGIDG